jgi:hypothetical protein
MNLLTLFELFYYKFSFSDEITISNIKAFLNKYNLLSFQCRIFIKIATIIHKTYFNQAPITLLNRVLACVITPKARCTRVVRFLLKSPQFNMVSCGYLSFQFFSVTFINKIFINAEHQLKKFKSWLINEH